jgi:nucleoside-diphosphate-sugar epimerase
MSTGQVLITGIEGFTGFYLKNELHECGYEIFGTVFQQQDTKHNIFQCDLCDTQQLAALIKIIAPDFIINLAGISFVQHNSAKGIFESNLLGVLSLLEAIKTSGHTPQKILLAGSAHVYGNQQFSPIKESCDVQPNSEYGISKLAMEQTARLWFDKLPIIIARPFNYTGIGQSSLFLPPKLVNHFAQKAPAIELGNTQIARDWSDVRDVVNIYRRLLESGISSTIVNVCSGVAHSIEYVLSLLRKISQHDLEIKTSQDLVRYNEITELCGDNNLLTSIVGKLSHRPLEQTLEWMYGAASKN